MSTEHAPGREPAPALYRAAQAIVKRLWRWSGGSVRLLGLEHLPAQGPALVLCNHQSYLDPILLQAHIRRPIYALAKSTSFSAPLTGPLMHRLCSFPVRRFQVDPQATRVALRHLGAGHIVAIYIEGERSWNGRLQEPRKGTVRLALKAGVPVVPCAISGTYEVMPRWQKKIRPGPISIVFGRPLLFPAVHRRSNREPLVPATARAIMGALAEHLPAEQGTGRDSSQ